MAKEKSIDDIIADFEVVDDWEERYRYLIDLGKKMPPMPEHLKNDATKVRGCASQVWLQPHTSPDSKAIIFDGDSDALIVRGLIALLLILYSGKSAEEILAIDARQILAKLGLDSNLSQQRSNGLHSMIERIRADAKAALQS